MSFACVYSWGSKTCGAPATHAIECYCDERRVQSCARHLAPLITEACPDCEAFAVYLNPKES